MRRAVPSFTVEVRRRPRLATTSNPDAQSSETEPPQAAFDRESHRAAAAAFGSKKVDPSPTDVASSPRGRILPSLVADEPLRRQLQDAVLTTAESDPPSRTPKRPSVRTSKRKDQASKLPRNSRNSSFSADENAPLAERSSTKSHRTSGVQSGEGAGASTSATTAPSQVGPEVRRCSQNEGKSCLRLGTTSEPSLCPTTKLPRWGRTLRPRFLRGATLSPLKVESEPSWLATSSAMNSNPASVGSGGCSRRDDEAPLPRCSWWSIPDPSRREPLRPALRSSLAVGGARMR